MADINLGVGGANSATGGYDIANSLKLESDNTERVNKPAGTISGAGNRRTFTISFWTKRTEINGVKQYLFEAGNSDSNTDRFTLRFGTGDTFDIQSQSTWLVTNRVFRDTSAWYHFVIKVDTTDGTAANRIKLYVNGVEETSFSIDNRSSINQNHDFPVNNTEDHIIGNSQIEGSQYYNGYIAEWIQLDGTAAAPTSFGEFDDDSGIWKPKDPSALSFGTNGFWLDFEDSSNLGNDASGGTDFTLTNITSTDQATDTPTNNFATGNPLVYFSNPTFNTFNALTEGATKLTKGANGWETLSSTIAVTSGKWYMEFQNIIMPESAMASVFPADIEFIGAGGQINNFAGKVSGDGGISYYSYDGNIFYNASNTSYGSAWANETNTMAIALDMDNGKVYFARANVWQNSGDPTSGATGTGAINLIEPSKPHMMGYAVYANNTSGAVNFGGYTPSSISSAASDANGYGNFEYAPPSGYYALCTKNLAEFG